MDLHKPRSGGQPQPSPAELAGRFVAFIPLGIDSEEATNEKGEKYTRHMVTTNLVIFGAPGERFQYGATEGRMGGPARPAQFEVTLPYRVDSAVYSQTQLVRAIRDFVGRGAVLGTIVKGTEGQRPWLLQVPADDDPRWAMAGAYFQAVKAAAAAGQDIQAPATPINQVSNGAQPIHQVYTPPAVYTPQPPANLAPAQYTAPATDQAPPGVAPFAWSLYTPEQKAAALQAAAGAATVPAGPNLAVPLAGYEAIWSGMNDDQKRQAHQLAAQNTY